MGRKQGKPRLLYAGTVKPARYWSFVEHFHEEQHEIILVLTGTVQVRMRGRVIEGGPGTSVLFPRGVMHAERSLGPKAFSTLFVGWIGPGVAEATGALSCVDQRGRLAWLMRWMLELSPSGAGAGRPAEPSDGLLQALLHEWKACCEREPNDVMSVVQQAMRERLQEPVTLADLAAIAGLSPFHFAREFRRVTGRPPMAYLRELRVEAARTLLLTTGLPLRAIAERVGFGDEFQLSRVFKRVTGEAPSGVRPRRG